MSAELCTNQGDRIRTALESLKDFGQESTIFFRRNEVEIVGQDKSGIVDIRLVLEASKICETGGYYKYDCAEDEIVLGIWNKMVAAALKRFSPGDKVVIGVNKASRRSFYVSCKNKGKNFTSEITDIAPMASSGTNVSGIFKYNGSIILDSQVFHSIIGDLLTAEPPTIAFECDGKTLKIIGEGMFSKSSVEIGDSQVIKPPLSSHKKDDGDDEDDDDPRRSAVFQRSAQGNGSSPWGVHESYATKHLQWIAKAKNIAPKIIISIAPNTPASFEYDTPICRLTYIVCSRSTDDIDIEIVEPPPDKKRRTMDQLQVTEDDLDD
jgi:hypothetical protein